MIKLLRIDDRLLHGQIAVAWTKSLSIWEIFIANDEVAKDEFTQMSLKMAKPRGTELVVGSVDDIIEKGKAGGFSGKKNGMIIVNCVKDASKIVHAFKEIRSVNLGGLHERPNSKRITGSVTLTDEDMEICRALMAEGVEIEIRQVPEAKKQLLKNIP